MYFFFLASAMAGVLSVSVSSAPTEATLEQALAACGGMEDRAARLECFDSLAAAANKASREEPAKPERVAAPPDAKPVDPEPRRADRQTPKPEKDAEPSKARYVIVAKDDPIAKAARPSEFEAKIVEAWLQFDKIYVRLDNGEVWKQTSRDRPRMPKAGQRATFTKGLVGWLASFGDSSNKHSFSLVK